MYAIWVGTLINIQQPVVVVAEEGKEEESILRLARVGYENVKGYLAGSFAAWKNTGKSVDALPSVTAEQFANAVSQQASVLDVRKLSEAENGHIKNATVLPLSELQKNLDTLPKDETLYVHCAGGYRSVIASSILKSHGFNKVINVHGGWNKIKQVNVPIETGVPANLIAE
jgi:rhodanese-related sulfurtransferase